MRHAVFVLTGPPQDTPVLALAPETPAEAATMPLITSLHRDGHHLTAYVGAEPAGIRATVTDRWAAAARAYGDAATDAAKIVLVLQPVPETGPAEYLALPGGVEGDRLPAWLPALLHHRYRAALRDVPVSTGPVPDGVLVELSGDHTDADCWAHESIGPA